MKAWLRQRYEKVVKYEETTVHEFETSEDSIKLFHVDDGQFFEFRKREE